MSNHPCVATTPQPNRPSFAQLEKRIDRLTAEALLLIDTYPELKCVFTFY